MREEEAKKAKGRVDKEGDKWPPLPHPPDGPHSAIFSDRWAGRHGWVGMVLRPPAEDHNAMPQQGMGRG